MSAALADIDAGVDALLAQAPYGGDPAQRRCALLQILRDALARAAQSNAQLANYYRSWPIDFRRASELAELPFLPASVFKRDPPLALVEREAITRTLASSATTGQTPSRVVLDAATSRRMSRGIVAIIRDFIGAERRPYLVVDTRASLAGTGEIGARAAAVQGLRSFATEIVCCLKSDATGAVELDIEVLLDFARRHASGQVLVYGFTYLIWQQLVQPLRAKGLRLDLAGAHLLHSGGWKRLQDEAVTRTTFNSGLADVVGCPESSVIDFYGMVENVGVIYPDCREGNKHVPAFGEVILRDPLTLLPVGQGQEGLVQICSALPSSFPGFLVLTEDIGVLVHEDGCPCGRRGTAFRFVKRAPKAEIRGCGNIDTIRARAPAKEGLRA